jgi:ribosomal protein S7
MKIEVYQEFIFRSKWLSKFITSLNFKGEKLKIEKIIYESLFFFKKYFIVNSFFFFFESLERLKPWVGLQIYKTFKLKKKKIKAYSTNLNSSIQYKKAIFWLIRGAETRNESKFYVKICNEIQNIVFNELTYSLKKKREYYNYAIMFKSVQKYKW